MKQQQLSKIEEQSIIEDFQRIGVEVFDDDDDEDDFNPDDWVKTEAYEDAEANAHVRSVLQELMRLK